MTFGYRFLQLPHQIMPLLLICILHRSTYSSKFYSLFSVVKYLVHNIAFMYHEKIMTSEVHVKNTASTSYQAHHVLGKCTMQHLAGCFLIDGPNMLVGNFFGKCSLKSLPSSMSGFTCGHCHVHVAVGSEVVIM